jgi:hypothetical protein
MLTYVNYVKYVMLSMLISNLTLILWGVELSSSLKKMVNSLLSGVFLFEKIFRQVAVKVFTPQTVFWNPVPRVTPTTLNGVGMSTCFRVHVSFTVVTVRCVKP